MPVLHNLYYFQDTHFQTVMRGFLRGILYCALWYGSIVAGFLLIACPLLPLLLLSPPKFRRCGDLLFSCWELYPAVSTANLDNRTDYSRFESPGNTSNYFKIIS